MLSLRADLDFLDDDLWLAHEDGPLHSARADLHRPTADDARFAPNSSDSFFDDTLIHNQGKVARARGEAPLLYHARLP